MTDPLDVLRTPPTPAPPDPEFAARLRARLARALDLPEGVIVSTTTLDLPAVATDEPLSTALTPYLSVAGARAAIDWYRDVLGAVVDGEPYVMPDGSIGHAELRIRGARLFLADEFPDLGLRAPAGSTSVTLHLDLPDVDAQVRGAVDAGATLEREPADNPYGRVGVIRDPFGHRWLLNGPVAAVVDGDVGYLSLWVPEVERAATFYAAVLGWRYGDAQPGGHRMILGGPPRALVPLASARAVFWPEQEDPTAFCSRAVADLDAAVARVRAAGGRATDPETTPHGRSAECADDQGMPFSLHEAAPGTPRPPANGTVAGDVAYLTLEVPDSARAREFHSAVFGWTFTGGHAEDGWQVEGPAPMTGLAGGVERAAVMPMYRVDDIGAAVARVRAAGGTAADPERQPYGISSLCTDDQGLRFYLGELAG